MLGFHDRRERTPVPPSELRSAEALVSHLSQAHGGAPLATSYAELRAHHDRAHQSDLAIQAVPHIH